MKSLILMVQLICSFLLIPFTNLSTNQKREPLPDLNISDLMQAQGSNTLKSPFEGSLLKNEDNEISKINFDIDINAVDWVPFKSTVSSSPNKWAGTGLV